MQRRPSTTFGPITACGPTTVPGAEPRAGIDVRRRIDPRLVIDGEHEVGLGHDLAIDRRRRLGAHDRRRAGGRATTSRRSRSPGTTCLRNLAFSTPRSETCPSVSSSDATWVSDSIISTPGISGVPGKCPWKNSSLTVTFLIATMRRPGSCSAMSSTRQAG